MSKFYQNTAIIMVALGLFILKFYFGQKDPPLAFYFYVFAGVVWLIGFTSSKNIKA